MESVARPIYTMGHATLGPDQFLELLRHYGVELLVDVRTVPRSRHNPQFNKDELSPFLRVRGIRYLHMKELGGWRRAVAGDPSNAGWRNASFRGYADYMQTPAFSAALDSPIELAGKKTTVLMCAESVPWRCHRSLIADALLVRGIEVIEIFSLKSAKPHQLSPLAVVDGTRISYPEKPDATD